ncbi:hypothetical protein [Streptomyces sp. S1D4-20]|uniref:hypothetical protein n=1 Tax=Streptomyces sp. S1D4-20 TaxID=2594462 RepID=UPI001164486A|nr:hypothetical protein [Streptomyces sp. S1D4-20]QDN54147.1 hypothetical protein FNV67_00800 [Streptomyces sp. S1D4-20]
MPDTSRDPVYLWLTGARPGARTPADMPARRPTAASASDIARREGIDLGNLYPYERRQCRGRGSKQPKTTVLSAVTRFATSVLRLPREAAVTHGHRWAASDITAPDEALEWITLLGPHGLDQAVKLRREGVTPAQEKARRAEARARREEAERQHLAERALEDALWAEHAARYRHGVANQLRLNGYTPDMLDREINGGKTADQMLREGRPVQIVINALREAGI